MKNLSTVLVYCIQDNYQKFLNSEVVRLKNSTKCKLGDKKCLKREQEYLLQSTKKFHSKHFKLKKPFNRT